MKSLSQFEIQTVEDGDVIVREGEEGRSMFIIKRGRVEIFKQVGGHEILLASLKRGDFFGEMSLLEGLPRSATARSLGSTELVVLRPGSLLLRIRQDPTFAFELLQQMSRRIRKLNDQLVFRVARAEFGNRLVRSSYMMTAASEYASQADALASEEV